MAGLTIPTGYGMWQFYMQHAGISHTSVVTLGFQVATPPYTATQSLNALNAWSTALLALYDNEVTFSKVVTLIGNDGPVIRFENTSTAQGTRASVVIASPNVTYLLKKSTSYAGRRFRGRMYLPYANAGGVTQTGQLSTAELAILTARAAAIQTGLVAAGPNASNLVLLHAESPLSATPAPTTVLSLAGEPFVATQRRRLERS